MVEYNIWKWFQSVKTFYTLCKSNVFGGKGLASVAGSILHGFNTEESDGLIFGSSGRMQAHWHWYASVSALPYLRWVLQSATRHDIFCWRQAGKKINRSFPVRYFLLPVAPRVNEYKKFTWNLFKRKEEKGNSKTASKNLLEIWAWSQF